MAKTNNIKAGPGGRFSGEKPELLCVQCGDAP